MAPRVSAGVTGAIRPIASAVIRSGGRVLVWDDLNPVTGEVVAVPLGTARRATSSIWSTRSSWPTVGSSTSKRSTSTTTASAMSHAGGP